MLGSRHALPPANAPAFGGPTRKCRLGPTRLGPLCPQRPPPPPSVVQPRLSSRNPPATLTHLPPPSLARTRTLPSLSACVRSLSPAARQASTLPPARPGRPSLALRRPLPPSPPQLGIGPPSPPLGPLSLPPSLLLLLPHSQRTVWAARQSGSARSCRTTRYVAVPRGARAGPPRRARATTTPSLPHELTPCPVTDPLAASAVRLYQCQLACPTVLSASPSASPGR